MSSRGRSQNPASSSSELNIMEQSEAQVCDSVLKQVEYGITQIEKLANELIPLAPNEQERDEVVRELEEQLLDVVKAQINSTDGCTNVLRQLQPGNDPEPDDNETEVNRFLKKCEEVTTRTNRKIEEFDAALDDNVLAKRHPTYLRIMTKINNIVNGGPTESGHPDESVEAGLEEQETCSGSFSEFELPTVDPITKKELKNPVRNKKCGHVYGKASITELIKTNSKLRCPIAGCSNKDFIKASDLATDRKLTLAIQKNQKMAKKNQT